MTESLSEPAADLLLKIPVSVKFPSVGLTAAPAIGLLFPSKGKNPCGQGAALEDFEDSRLQDFENYLRFSAVF